MELIIQHAPLLEWLGFISVLTFIGSLIAIPWIIARLPSNYFIRHRQKVAERHERNPLVARLTFVFRNIFGIVFLAAGVAMLMLPGQGIITILIGITFMDFPRKHAMVDYLVRRPRVVKFLNWIRKREKKPPFVF